MTPSKRDYYVVDEDGDSLHVHATDPQAAANAALREWQLEADPGYRFLVFDAADANLFKISLTLVPDDDDDDAGEVRAEPLREVQHG